MAHGLDGKADMLRQAQQFWAADDLPAAEALFREIVAADPSDPEPRHLWAGVLAALGRSDDAETEYRRVLALAPGAPNTARALAMLVLGAGRYDEGFALYERRHELAELAKPPLPFSEWRGEPVAGRKLLIWPEQGLGDQIQFARFAPLLASRGADVTLVCAPPLARLFEGSLGVRVLSAAGVIDFPDPDFWVMALSLAARFGVTPQTVPAASYLKAIGPVPPLPNGFKVGLVTRGNPGHLNDRHRSLPDSPAERLRAVPVQVVSLDPGETGAADFADTAAIVAGLDLVITVDTAVAHLAGAMGKPCWTLLTARNTDWRWGRSGSHSPWYPSMRLYRQATPGDWIPTVDQVIHDLKALAAG
jgi:tetratricopeptide repeat protein/glycosyl transferase family 9 (putative heptosyltransferase)